MRHSLKVLNRLLQTLNPAWQTAADVFKREVKEVLLISYECNFGAGKNGAVVNGRDEDSRSEW